MPLIATGMKVAPVIYKAGRSAAPVIVKAGKSISLPLVFLTIQFACVAVGLFIFAVMAGILGVVGMISPAIGWLLLLGAALSGAAAIIFGVRVAKTRKRD